MVIFSPISYWDCVKKEINQHMLKSKRENARTYFVVDKKFAGRPEAKWMTSYDHTFSTECTDLLLKQDPLLFKYLGVWCILP